MPEAAHVVIPNIHLAVAARPLTIIVLGKDFTQFYFICKKKASIEAPQNIMRDRFS